MASAPKKTSTISIRLLIIMGSKKAVKKPIAERQVSDTETRAVVKGHGGDIVLVQRDHARIRHQHAGQHLKGGGLARAIGTQQAHDFAALKLQCHVFDHPAPGERFHQMLRRKHACSSNLRGVALVRRSAESSP